MSDIGLDYSHFTVPPTVEGARKHVSYLTCFTIGVRGAWGMSQTSAKQLYWGKREDRLI